VGLRAGLDNVKRRVDAPLHVKQSLAAIAIKFLLMYSYIILREGQCLLDIFAVALL
jgi:hypothetical protein